MRTVLALATAAVVAASGASALAADTPAKSTPSVDKSAPANTPTNAQQERMKTCNANAGDMKGDARQAFMKTCLSGKDAAAKTTRQEKMKECNVRAQGKKGDERKAFMSECLKG
jgi:psiF repeat-containing protein